MKAVTGLSEREKNIKKKKIRTNAESAKRRRIILLSIILLAVLTSITFSPASKAGFLQWDDPRYITDNVLVRELSFRNIKMMFLPQTDTDYIMPLVMLSYAIEHEFFGFNPAVFHVVNVLVHIINVVLVLYFIFKLRGNYLIAFITAAFFAVHPMRAETVLWITERKDLLATLFFLASLIFYTDYVRKMKGRFYVRA